MTILNRFSTLFAEPTDTDNPGGGGGDTPAFTDAQLKALGGLLNQTVTSHLKRQPPLAEQLQSMNWAELLAPVVKGMIPEAPSQEDPKSPRKPELSEYEKQIATISKELETFRKKAADAENMAKASEMARKIDAATLKLRSALTGKVQEHALDHAVNHLTLVGKRLVVDEDGTARIKVKKPLFAGYPPEEQELPIEEAISDVLSESDMKIFLPAPRGNGSNPGPAGGKGALTSASFTGEPKSEAEKLMRAQILEQEFKAKLNIA